jgi:sodium/potassium-transporting ATPase subunit alpha
MKIHQLSIDEVFASVSGGAEGLSTAEALHRLEKYGPNHVESVVQQPAIWRLFKEFTQFFSVILWVASGLAFAADWFDPGQGMAHIGYAVIAVIIVSGVFSFWQEYRIEQTLAALQKLLPQSVKLLRDKRVVERPVDQVVVGDIVLLEAGDIVPADCRLIEGFGVRVNTGTITGESASKALHVGPSDQEDLIHSRNILLAGTSLVSGDAIAVVFATGALTEFGKIAQLSQPRGEVASPLRKQLAYLSRLIAVLAIMIGVAFFAIGTMIGVPFWQDFIFSIGIIVAMVPEGLMPTLTLTLVLAGQRMAKRNVLIRHLTSVETLGSATVICTDKTGTLTENRMRARELLLGQERHSAAKLDEGDVLGRRYRDFFLGAALCHNLKNTEPGTGGTLIGDPMEVALAEVGRKVLSLSAVPLRLNEISFDSDRMRQSVVHAMPEGAVLFCKGAPEAVLPLCNRAVIDGVIVLLDQTAREKIIRSQEAMAEDGLRVLAFASRSVAAACDRETLEQDLVFQGLVGLEDPPRPEVHEAVRKCQEAGIKIIMVTGDHPRTATAIARQVGLVGSKRPEVMTGDQLRRLSGVGLQLALDAPEIIFARVAADQKLRIVEALMGKRHIVAVTGDGVNDAPALKAAHIGIAMGIAGSDVAKQAADVVLLDDNFASIVNAVEEGRAVFQNIRKFLTYVLIHNVAELVPYIAFALFRIPLPLTPIQALCVDMGTDSLTALGLGVERPDPQVMRLPPRPQKERLLNWPVALRAYLFLGIIEATAAMAAFFYVLTGGGWSFGTSLPASDPLYLRATTACLSAIIVLQIVNVFLCRSSVRSIFSTGFTDNRLILWGVALEIALMLLIVYMPLANAAVGTAPLPRELWLFLLPFAAAMLTLEELRKWIVRRTLKRSTHPLSTHMP